MKKKLRLLLFILCSLVLLLVFATLLLPSKGQVVSATTIYASDSIVWQELTALQSYPHWFPWIAGSHAAVIYYGNEGRQLEGFSFKGQGQNGGYGRFELGRKKGDSLMHFNLRFKDMPAFYGAYILKEAGRKTIVVWKLNMKAGWKPWWRFYAAMMNKITKPVLDSGLAKLKKICEDSAQNVSTGKIVNDINLLP